MGWYWMPKRLTLEEYLEAVTNPTVPPWRLEGQSMVLEATVIMPPTKYIELEFNIEDLYETKTTTMRPE
jgi:hypothetical protein